MYDDNPLPRVLGAVLSAIVLAAGILSIIHGVHQGSKISRDFLAKPLCAGNYQGGCFNTEKVLITGRRYQQRPKLSTIYYVDLVRANGLVEEREVASSGYDFLPAHPHATASLYHGNIVILSAEGNSFGTDYVPGGGTAWIIIGTILVIFGGAGLVIALMFVFIG
jgi:hypothetical protein